jgi:hypothetical protein
LSSRPGTVRTERTENFRTRDALAVRRFSNSRRSVPHLVLLNSPSHLKSISDTRIAHYRRHTLQACITLHRPQLHIARAGHSRSAVGSQYSSFRKGFTMYRISQDSLYVIFLLFPFQDVLFHNSLTVERRHLRPTLVLAVACIETIHILDLISLAWV